MMTEIKKNKLEPVVVSDLRFEKYTNSPASGVKENLAYLFEHVWKKTGLAINFSRALELINSLDLAESFGAVDKSGVSLASLHTLPVSVPGIRELIETFPNYKSVTDESNRAKSGDKSIKPTHRICFSITAMDGYCAGTENNKSESLEGFLLRRLPDDNMRKVAFSRFWNIEGKSPDEIVRFYLENLEPGKSRNLGAAGMHEAFGGIVAAILIDSRPEDKNGGGANVIVVYPKNEEEANLFKQIKERRRKEPVQIDHVGKKAIIFNDLPEGI